MLRQPAADGRDAAVRWRQLVDLIARAGAAADPELLTEALGVIRGDLARIDEPLRAAAARAIAALPLPLGLLECFVADRLSVSAPILAAAKLDSGQWQKLLAIADGETKRFIETLHPDLVAATPSTGLVGAAELSIGDLVTRIERRRKDRTGRVATPATEAATPVAPIAPVMFRWETAANGEIEWVDGVPRGALVGRSLAKAADGGGERVAAAIVRAMTNRAPFRDGELIIVGDGPAAGRWLVSGAPVFDPADGRFAGFHGVARSERQSTDEAVVDHRSTPMPLDSDSLRELVHELKTPLNAIIGFAEIIDGQFLGPAGRRYRDRADDIAGEARLLLGAIDDLDLAAKLQTSNLGAHSLAGLDAVTTHSANAVRHSAEKRGVELVFAPPSRPVEVAVDAKLLARLITRLLQSVIDVSVSGERLRLGVDRKGSRPRLTITRPIALSGGNIDDGDYELRLAKGLMRIAGGDVRVEGNVLVADFPPG